MSDQQTTSRPTWSRRKKDQAPRGVFRHPSGMWAIRYACGAGCAKHEEKVGPLKSDAKSAYHERRARARREPGWCPAVERREARKRAQAEEGRERGRMTFRQYAENYLAWSATVHRAQRTAKYEVGRLVTLLGDTPLDTITPADVERCVRTLGETLAPASVNRLRDRLSGMFKRARRLGLVEVNPVTGIPKLKEAGGRLAFVSRVGEDVLLAALPVARRPLVTLAVNTGLRWSEQVSLRWYDVDMLTGFLTVRLGKNGQARRVPLNSSARGALMDLGAERRRPNDPDEPVARAAYRTVTREFVRPVGAAQVTLRASGRPDEAARLGGVTWHALRHTFASRLVAAGVDLRTVQELGGWKTLSMVQRYAHLSPGHLVAAVEKIVAVPSVAAPGGVSVPEVRRNFDSVETGSRA
jgi:site-specific recombinase XerD